MSRASWEGGALGHRRSHTVPLPGSFWDPGLPRACRVTDHGPGTYSSGLRAVRLPQGWGAGQLSPGETCGQAGGQRPKAPGGGLPGLEGMFGGGGQGWAVHSSAVGWGQRGPPPHAAQVPRKAADPAVSSKAEDAGPAESIPRTGPAPWAACTGRPAPRSRDQLKAREAAGLWGDEPLGPLPRPPLSVLGAQHPSPHSVVGAQNPCPMPGTPMQGCLSWEPLSRAVTAVGQAPSRVLGRGFPGKPQPGGGLRGRDTRGQRRGSECRAQVGTAAGHGPGRQRASWPVVVIPRDSLARVLAGGGVRAVSPHQAPRCPRPPS